MGPPSPRGKPRCLFGASEPRSPRQRWSQGLHRQGPLRLLRRHLPLKGEDFENGDVLPLQGSPTRTSGHSVPPTGRLQLRTTMSSPFRGRWPAGPEGAHQRALHREALPLQGSPTRTSRALHRQNTVSTVEAASRLTARALAGDCSFGATTAAPPVRFAPGALLPRTPPVFRGELRPPRTPPAGGLLASLRTSPWTPCAGPVPAVDGSQGSKAGA